MLETKEIRLEKYSVFSDEKRESILCPVCNRPFTNKYSLSNQYAEFLNNPPNEEIIRYEGIKK